MKILETKVLAGAAGAGAGGAFAQFLLWLLGVLVWHQSADAASSATAQAAIPTPVATIIVLLAAAAGSWAAGYAAPHTSRPDLAIVAPVDQGTAGATLVPDPTPVVAPVWPQVAAPGVTTTTIPGVTVNTAPVDPTVTPTA